MRADFPPSLVELGSADGTLFGVPGTTAVAGLVWYNPTIYDGPTSGTLDELPAGRRRRPPATTPWCIGLESGPSSGWPGAVWIEELCCSRPAPRSHQVVEGRAALDRAADRQAFERFGAIATDAKQVSGGPTAVLTTDFNSSPQGLFAEPPACHLHVQADFLGNAIAQTVPGVVPGTDIDFFPFPPVDPARGRRRSRSPARRSRCSRTARRAGRSWGTWRRPSSARSSPAPGQWIAANRRTPLDAYTSVLSRRAAGAYAGRQDGAVRRAERHAARDDPGVPQGVLAYVSEAVHTGRAARRAGAGPRRRVQELRGAPWSRRPASWPRRLHRRPCRPSCSAGCGWSARSQAGLAATATAGGARLGWARLVTVGVFLAWPAGDVWLAPRRRSGVGGPGQLPVPGDQHRGAHRAAQQPRVAGLLTGGACSSASCRRADRPGAVRAVVKAAVVAPIAISFVAGAIIWQAMFEYQPSTRPQIGTLNAVLAAAPGVDPVAWLVDTKTNNAALIAVGVWMTAGFATIMLSAALKGVPAELLEASRMDGAGSWQTFRYVTLPELRPPWSWSPPPWRSPPSRRSTSCT